MRFAIIDNGTVTNIVLADEATGLARGWVALPGGFGIGDTYDGEAFTKAPPPAPPVPASVERHQALLALLDAGITEAAILAAIDADTDLTDTEKAAFRIRVSQPLWVRHSPFIAWGQVAFDLTEAQGDALFVAAQTK